MARVWTLEEALESSREEIRQGYREYVNSSLVGYLGLLNFDRAFVRASGCEVWDSEGNVYLDFLGGFGALNLGHNPPRVIEAVQRCLERQRPNLLQSSLNGLASALAESLAAILPTGLTYAFFCNSGAEAVEGALKTARAATARTVILSTEGSFHGKSFGALSASGREKYRAPFAPLVPGCEHIPYNDVRALEQRLQAQDVAAFIVEPVQGEGGVVVPDRGYLAAARAACSRTGTLLIADEIQTGFGRTGALFACQHEQVCPDIITLAKSLGGGVMPIGAFVCSERVWKRAYGSMDTCLLHTSTFGGNALACAAGIAAINCLLEEDLAAQAAAKGQYLLERLKVLKGRYPLIRDVRGKGLLVGIEFAQPSGLLNRLSAGRLGGLSYEYLGAMVAGALQNEHRIITAYTLNNPNVIRLEPPLTVTYAQIDRGLQALEDVVEKNGSLVAFVRTSAVNRLRS
jgi:putrescine aminotransferase